MGKLTARGIKALTRPGRYADGGCLHLIITPTGSKNWVLRTVVQGTRRDIGLGGLEWRTLGAARALAHEYRAVARQGGDPRRPKVMTFRQASEKALEANRARWRHAKTADNWRATMQQYAFPAFGDTPLTEIDGTAVLAVLTPIWTAKPELARKVRQRIRATFGWAMAHGLVEQNAAGERIASALPSTKAALTKHFRGRCRTPT